MSVPTKFSLFKRNNGVYYVAYREGFRRRWKSTECTTRHDALRRVAELKSLLKAKAPYRTLTQFLEEYRIYGEAHLSKGTLAGYLNTLRNFQSSVGELALSAITARQADAYIGSRAREVRPATVNIELRSLRAVFSVAGKWGYVEHNPFQQVKVLVVPDQSAAFFSRDDFERLLAVVEEGWLRDLIIFSVSTGTRRGEVLNLRWPDVDLARRLIHVQSSATFTTKRGKRRTIPMNDLVHAVLARKSRQMADGYIFQRRNRQIGHSYLSHLFKRYIRLAELDDGLHFHSLRHTHASWLAQDGVSLYVIQKLLGHSSSAVTQIYAYLAASELHGAVNKIVLELPTPERPAGVEPAP